MVSPRTESVQVKDREIDRLESVDAAGFVLLRFPADIESQFAADFASRYLGYRRLVILLTLVAVVLAGFIDASFARGHIDYALILRYGLITPLLVAVVLFSRTARFSAWQQPTLAILVLALAGLLFGIMLVGDQLLVLTYLPGVLLLAIYAGLLLHLRFWLAVPLLLFIGLIYIAFLYWWRPQATEIVATYAAFYFLASAMALFTGYGVEHTARRQFLQRRLLQIKQDELELANRQLQALADLDGLTGIANRRRFDEHLMSEWGRALRSGYPLSVLLIDLDHFKKYNDTYGHQAGDDCLIVVGAVLHAHAQRPGDLAARYGGEEFALILPDTDRNAAEEIGWRIVRDMAAYRIPHQSSPVADVVTCSVGVATVVPTPIVSARELVAATDQALYSAKGNGRNRVEVAPAVIGDQAPPMTP